MGTNVLPNTGALETAYVDDAAQAGKRLRAIIAALDRYQLGNLGRTKGLGFCVSIRHAEFMAEQFTLAGIKSAAVTSQTDDAARKRAVRELQARDEQLRFVFTVDLFNEGLDVPEINTVLFLRPTESLTVFLQQLGRGLRHSAGKDYLQVLDFVAQMHKRYRVDRKFAALLPGGRTASRMCRRAAPFTLRNRPWRPCLRISRRLMPTCALISPRP